uniref:Uncharacterized protein n=1 Tax=Biomphalaria glabrata TaxID=6526 RepID=A0A2C9LES3_BIOGL
MGFTKSKGKRRMKKLKSFMCLKRLFLIYLQRVPQANQDKVMSASKFVAMGIKDLCLSADAHEGKFNKCIQELSMNCTCGASHRMTAAHWTSFIAAHLQNGDVMMAGVLKKILDVMEKQIVVIAVMNKIAITANLQPGDVMMAGALIKILDVMEKTIVVIIVMNRIAIAANLKPGDVLMAGVLKKILDAMDKKIVVIIVMNKIALNAYLQPGDVMMAHALKKILDVMDQQIVVIIVMNKIAINAYLQPGDVMMAGALKKILDVMEKKIAVIIVMNKIASLDTKLTGSMGARRRVQGGALAPTWILSNQF